MINSKKLLIGSDPEAFLRNRKTLEVVSAIGLIPGTKYDPSPMENHPEGFNIQTDNVMVEWCVPPVSTPQELYANIQKCITYTNRMIPAELEVAVIASAFLDEKYLNSEQACTFGCESSDNAWTYQTNQAPDGNTNLRTAGGHIHIGYENPNDNDSVNLIRALDLFLNIPSLILDKDVDRKKMYGKAGEFRMKSYGVEYRGLSNYWIDNLNYIKFIFAGIEKAVEFVNAGKEFSDEDQLLIQSTINDNNKIEAYKLINKYNLDQILTSIFVID